MQKKHFIGQNLAFFRAAQKISQPELGTLSHMSQSKISRFETNELAALPEEIEALANALGVHSDLLTTCGTVFSNYNQQGGYAEKYHFHNGTDQIIQTINEHITTLKRENAAKDELITYFRDKVGQLEAQLAILEHKL